MVIRQLMSVGGEIPQTKFCRYADFLDLFADMFLQICRKLGFNFVDKT